MSAQSRFPQRFSFEFFPPRTEAGVQKLQAVQTELAAVQPAFFSVTYGAGGSTRDHTLETVLSVRRLTGIDAAPHLSCIGDNKQHLSELLQTYRNSGIRQLVALRGDLPSGTYAAGGELKYASDLVKFIRETTGDHFQIEVAAYPEMHPQASSFKADLVAFQTKVAAGANSAITQYFYNADAYLFFVESCARLGVNIPIVPGIMPITNYENLMRFSNACGAEIPRWIRVRLESYAQDPVALKQFGEEAVTRLCEDLLRIGAPGLHFYTLNQAEPTLAIWRNLGI
jgi:methylenetetrahydrofolate reductase (NADPH)